jgi:hypothetical protein
MSDTTDFTIVITLLFLLICYVSYIRKLIDSVQDINNTKCNPVNLFLKAIYADSDSPENVDDFAQCVQSIRKHGD